MKDADLSEHSAVRVTGRWEPFLPHGAVSLVTAWKIPSDDPEADRLPKTGSVGLVY